VLRSRRRPAGTTPRIAVYTDFSYRRDGARVSAELPFILFLAEVSRQGAGMTVVGREDPSARSFPFTLPEHLRYVGLPHYPSLASPVPVARAAIASARAFAAGTRDADIVWLFGPHPFCFLFAGIARARGQRIVLGVRQDLPAMTRARHPRSRWLVLAARILERGFRRLARRNAAVVVGPSLAEDYRRSGALLETMINLVPAADVVPPGGSRSSGAQHTTILSVGRLDPEKNPLLLADVLADLHARRPGWRLIVCGGGSMANALEARLAELGLADDARLAGFVPMGDPLMELYRSSDVFLHVSWTEGVPQVLFEAFAAGLPVVATRVGGVADAVGDAALLVDPGDAAQAADAVRRVVEDRELRDRLVQRGLHRATETSLDVQAASVFAFLRRL
jgi:glycosyltransferase involved in cell wall biosynthesis